MKCFGKFVILYARLFYSKIYNLTQGRTRHRASTSMYLLTFCITTPPQYGRNGTVHAAGTSTLSLARGVFVGMRSACGGPDGLPLGSATHFECCHSNVTRAPIANPPNSAQLAGIPYSIKLHPGLCNSVGMQAWTDRHTETHTHVTTIHFASSTTHAKCTVIIYNLFTDR